MSTVCIPKKSGKRTTSKKTDSRKKRTRRTQSKEVTQSVVPDGMMSDTERVTAELMYAIEKVVSRLHLAKHINNNGMVQNELPRSITIAAPYTHTIPVSVSFDWCDGEGVEFNFCFNHPNQHDDSRIEYRLSAVLTEIWNRRYSGRRSEVI